MLRIHTGKKCFFSKNLKLDLALFLLSCVPTLYQEKVCLELVSPCLWRLLCSHSISWLKSRTCRVLNLSGFPYLFLMVSKHLGMLSPQWQDSLDMRLLDTKVQTEEVSVKSTLNWMDLWNFPTENFRVQSFIHSALCTICCYRWMFLLWPGRISSWEHLEWKVWFVEKTN